MVLGIDLGTTNSVAAYVDENGVPHAIANWEGKTTTPSVVYFESEQRVVVGESAKSFMAAEPKKVVSNVKKTIGLPNSKTYNPMPGRTFRAQDVSSLVLRKLVKDAAISTGNREKITDVVVTVPAYFSDKQRQATFEAVRLAGLNLLAFVNEPTAAAIFYANQYSEFQRKMEHANTLVFDLGGGTFDTTVMQINGMEVEVKSTDGISNIGGTWFDEQLVEYIRDQFEEKHGIDLEDDEYLDIYGGLFEKVETAKKQVCATKGTAAPIPVIAGGEKEIFVITYEDFVRIVAKKCDQIENKVKRAINDAGLTVDDITQVIMVGGSSRIPYIEERITKLMGKEPLRVVNPDEVVALGAALYADRISRKKANMVKDVYSHGRGILRYSPKTETQSNYIMIRKNTTLPTSVRSEEFAFAKDGQEYVKIAVTEGDFEEATDVTLITEMKQDLPAGIRRGMKYTLEMEADEMMNLQITLAIPELGWKGSLKIGTGRKPENQENESDISEQAKLLQQMDIA